MSELSSVLMNGLTFLGYFSLFVLFIAVAILVIFLGIVIVYNGITFIVIISSKIEDSFEQHLSRK